MAPSAIGQETLHEAVNGLAWVHEPIQVVLPPEQWQAAGVLGHFVPAGHEAAARLDTVLAEAIDGPNSLLARREVIDEYGWRNYGDLYADHENAHYPGPKPVISHYNNQFDVIYGAILQEARTGNPAWRAVYDPLARHVMDIDIYHTQEDRPAYNGGLFWPTDHYKTAHTATHRTYSRHNLPPEGSPYGGGPGPEHNYATGLLYYYYLTGNPDARQAVVQLAEWVLQMDDGSQTPWGILDPGPTGLASATRSADYHGPGRGAANSIQTLLDAWQLTGQRKYLSKAEELIRRTIHPADDIGQKNLLDAENRWSYTMYLAALARYLEMKIQQNELDGMYRYGQAALVHYGAWMAEQERPYLDHPGQLEYVTEAWAVQELRKANAMRVAARHAEEPLRSRLLDRAAELADRAWNDWAGFPTRMTTRALAVLLIEGVRDAYYRAGNDPPAPQIGGPKHFGVLEPFLPQRERVRRLLGQPSGWIQLGWALVQPNNWIRLIRTVWRYRN
ncbi:MAG: glycoside hydrolase family 127 protein [Thermoguttaceae bacterium]|nr:glycoside hydrolase family 127 protein [Thermoguttaceae bacterium]